MAVASSQVGQVFTGPLFSIKFYVGVATTFNDQFSHSWSKSLKDHSFMCPPDHSTTVCYGLAVRVEITHSEQQLGLKSEQRSENSHSTIFLRRKLMRIHRNGHRVYKTIILFPIPCAWPIVSMIRVLRIMLIFPLLCYSSNATFFFYYATVM